LLTGRVSVNDLLYLSSIIYADGDIFQSQFNTWFNSDEWTYEIQDTNYFHYGLFTVTRNNETVRVVSCRGTLSLYDFVVNVDLFIDSVFLQFGGIISPLLNYWPDWLKTSVITAMSIAHRFLVKTTFYDLVTDYVKSFPDTNNTIIIGHSLGGAVATIVGGRLNLPIFTINAPGIIWSLQKFNIPSRNVIDINSVNIKTLIDPISKIGESGGAIQNIGCDAETTFNCHGYVNAGCELMKICGDIYNRTFTICPNPALYIAKVNLLN